MQFMSICNKVLTKLRKSNLTSSNFATDTYGLLIQQYVNEAKHEVENSWRWSMLRETITVTTDGTNDTFTLTGATQRSQLLDIYNASQQWLMRNIPQDKMRAIKQTTASPNGNPYWYTLTSDSQITDNTVVINIWPYAVSGESLNAMFYTPQADLSAYDDNLYIPEQPVIFLAFAKAIEERGEDGGNSFVTAYGQYEKALAQAIAIDSQRMLESADWKVV